MHGYFYGICHFAFTKLIMDNYGLTENDDDVLKAFGGATINNLNSVIDQNDENYDEMQVFRHSSYYDLHTISNSVLPSQNSFNILSLNVQSIYAKFDALTSFLQVLSDKDIIFDAITLQETWLSSADLSQKEKDAFFYKDSLFTYKHQR